MKAQSSVASLSLLICLSATALFGQAPAAKYPILNWQQLETRGQSAGMRMFFYLLRNDAGLLNSDEDVFGNFIAANNCQNPNLGHQLSSEFDFPAMKAFYQAQAAQILQAAPTTLRLTVKGFYLGQYDTAKHVFPFVDPHGTKNTPIVFRDLEPNNDLHDTCPTMAAQGVSKSRNFYAYYMHYQIKVQPMTIAELPMDEAAARSFVEGLRFGQAGAGRQVSLSIDMDLIDAPTKLGPHQPNTGYAPVSVQAKVTKVTIYSLETNRPIGVITP